MQHTCLHWSQRWHRWVRWPWFSQPPPRAWVYIRYRRESFWTYLSRHFWIQGRCPSCAVWSHRRWYWAGSGSLRSRWARDHPIRRLRFVLSVPSPYRCLLPQDISFRGRRREGHRVHRSIRSCHNAHHSSWLIRQRKDRRSPTRCYRNMTRWCIYRARG